MSEQPGSTAAPAATLKDQIAIGRLQHLLLGTTVPLAAGGGVVFPKGFPFRGLQLDEWQFDRYCAELDQVVLSAAERRRTRIGMFVSLSCLVILCLLIFARPWVKEAFDWLNAGQAYAASIVVVALIAITFSLGLHRRSDFRFARKYADAPRVGRFDFLYARGVRLLASGFSKPSSLAFWLAVSVAAMVALYVSDYFAEHHTLLRLTVLVMLLYGALRRIFMLGVYLRFRLRHGRAPGPEELKPLSRSIS